MTRRTPTPRVGEAGRRANRMAPGGRLYSESPITSFLPSFGSGATSTFALLSEDRNTRAAGDEPVAPGPYSTLAPTPEPY